MASIIVVGAGAGGLTAAGYLRHAGHQVLLLEAKDRVGGCASSFTTQGFRFLSGATTLIGLEPDMPLGTVLRELEIPVQCPIARNNLEVWQGGRAVTVSTRADENRVALTERYGPSFAQFWDACVALGTRAWRLLPSLAFPPAGPADLLGLASSSEAWRLLPSMLRTTRSALRAGGPISAEVELGLDELLRISTQGTAASTPALFGALGLEYLQRPFFLHPGGIAGLLERLAEVLVGRGVELQLSRPVSAVRPLGKGFEVVTGEEQHSAEAVVLNLTHWDAARLLPTGLGPDREVRRHPDAWSACTLHLGVEDPVDLPDAPRYHQLVLEKPLPRSGARSMFVTVPAAGEGAPAGFRAVTVSCHASSSAFFNLEPAAHREAKLEVGAELLEAVYPAFPRWRSAAKPVVLPGTPRTWEGFTGREGGRVGGLPFTFTTLRRGFPSGRTRHPRLWRVGDTVFPGQSVLASAWGARRVAAALIRNLGDSEKPTLP